MNRIFASGAVACLALALSGCATLVRPGSVVDPLALAFTETVPSLEARAGNGENAAEYALAFLTRFGLRGVPEDQARSERLRSGAMTPTTLMITQYIAPIGGGAGRTHLIPVTQPGLSREQMALLDLCGLAAMAGVETTGRQVCTPDGWDRIAPLARQAALERAASTPLP